MDLLGGAKSGNYAPLKRTGLLSHFPAPHGANVREGTPAGDRLGGLSDRDRQGDASGRWPAAQSRMPGTPLASTTAATPGRMVADAPAMSF